MKLKTDDRAVDGQRAEFDLPIATMSSCHQALLLAAILDRAHPGEQHWIVVYEALARAEDFVRRMRSHGGEEVNRGQN